MPKRTDISMAEYARNHGGMTAVEFTGKHYDMGNKLKVVEAQVELALQHPEIGCLLYTSPWAAAHLLYIR